MNTLNLKVKGMHCASCAITISKRIKKIPGVVDVNINSVSETADIKTEKHIPLEQLNSVIQELGYSFVGDAPSHVNHGSMGHMHDMGGTQEERNKELDEAKKKVVFTLPFSIVVFLLMMWEIGAEFLNFIPKFPVSMSVLNALLFVIATPILFWSGKSFVNGVARFAMHRVANMETLVGLGTLTAYIYSSVIVLFPVVRDYLKLPEFVFFDVTIVVVGFVLLGRYLESRSKLQTGEAIEKLLGLQAKTAIVVRGGVEIEISISDVVVGDLFIVRPGAKIPVDGVVVDGFSSIDESMVTGESMPNDKKTGDSVIGGTINKQGVLKCTAMRVGSDTMLLQIVKIVREAQSSRAPIQSLADKISGIFVPVALGVALVSLIIWFVVGSYYLGFSSALSYGILAFVGVLVIACPCALGLATPTAIVVGVGRGAEYGILIKGAESLEQLSRVNVIVFDKTGTITNGVPQVVNVVSSSSYSEQKILEFAASVEYYSEHPLARAIVEEAKKRSLTTQEPKQFNSIEGVGVTGVVDTKNVSVRKPTQNDLIKEPIISKLQSEGKTVVVLVIDEVLVGIIALSDTIKKDVPNVINALHKRGIRTVLLTGDNENSARYIAHEAGIDEVIAGVIPSEKAKKIKELQAKKYIVAMVGDGINDAPALTQAHVGIAMATGTDVAIEAAGITLLRGDVTKVLQVHTLAKKTMRTIRENLFWAFIYNVLGIPLAAGVFFPLFGVFINPVFAGIAMAGSSVSVVTNSLRLKRTKLK